MGFIVAAPWNGSQPRQYANQYRGRIGHPSALLEDIHQISSAIWNTGGHLLFPCLHGKNLYPHINEPSNIETKVFYKKVMGYKGIFSLDTFVLQDSASTSETTSLTSAHSRG